jgi:hypothetical protein
MNLCGSVEAFDPVRRDKPADPLAPFVQSITFHGPVSSQPAQSDQQQPPRGRGPRAVLRLCSGTHSLTDLFC